MYLSELNWDDVPEDVSVLVDGNDKELNFVKNLTRPLSGTCRYEGDECDIEGLIFSYGEGWYNNWTLLERPAKEQPVQNLIAPMPPEEYNNVVVDWLNKYSQVFIKTQALDTLKTNEDGVYLFTDYGDIRGTKQVVEFINIRYHQLNQIEADKRKAELEAKRLKVLQELSDIDQELNRYGE